MRLANWHVAVAVAIVITIVAITNISGCNEGGDGDIFPQPEQRHSRNGILRTNLEAVMALNFLENRDTGELDEVNTPTFERALIAPTFRVKPGDTIEFDLVNNLPPNPDNPRPGPTNAFPHNQYSTNFHTHGLSVSPRGISDNVLRIMAPGTTHEVRVEIPADHACGTFWYHPHKHGSVSFQFFGGMLGFLIIDGEDCAINQIPEIAAAKDVQMGIAVIRTDSDGEVPFVNPEAETFSQNPGRGVTIPSLWQFFQNTTSYVTVNGVVNPTLKMRPGEVQRWRILNAASGLTMVPALEGHSLSIIAQDGLNLPEVTELNEGEGFVMGAGNRVDFMVKAGEPGTYLLQALDPTTTPRSVSTLAGIDPDARNARISMDFPNETYPITLATIEVTGAQMDMELPSGPLPSPNGLPSVQEMLSADMAQERSIAFEICSPNSQTIMNEKLNDVCTFYQDRYDDNYWGGTRFLQLMMMRDANETGTPNPVPDPDLPFIFEKEGLFTSGSVLFEGDEAMVTGTFEEWTLINRTNSDHPFHIHQNPVLITHINGVELDTPEWRDTMLVPAADTSNNGNLVDNAGSVTYRTWYDPITFGAFVMHCHILTHEDIGMMQELEIVEAE